MGYKFMKNKSYREFVYTLCKKKNREIIPYRDMDGKQLRFGSQLRYAFVNNNEGAVVDYFIIFKNGKYCILKITTDIANNNFSEEILDISYLNKLQLLF